MAYNGNGSSSKKSSVVPLPKIIQKGGNHLYEVEAIDEEDENGAAVQQRLPEKMNESLKIELPN